MFNTFYLVNMGDFDEFNDTEIKDYWISTFVYFFLFYFSTIVLLFNL